MAHRTRNALATKSSMYSRARREKRFTMRIGEMTPKGCREILAHTSLGRLGCSREDQPYVVPIYFVYEPDHLYGFATDGQKIDWMRTNPKVCVELDEIRNHFQWTSVVLYGRYPRIARPAPICRGTRPRAEALRNTRPLVANGICFSEAQVRRRFHTAAVLLHRNRLHDRLSRGRRRPRICERCRHTNVIEADVNMSAGKPPLPTFRSCYIPPRRSPYL